MVGGRDIGAQSRFPEGILLDGGSQRPSLSGASCRQWDSTCDSKDVQVSAPSSSDHCFIFSDSFNSYASEGRWRARSSNIVENTTLITMENLPSLFNHFVSDTPSDGTISIMQRIWSSSRTTYMFRHAWVDMVSTRPLLKEVELAHVPTSRRSSRNASCKNNEI